MGVIENIEKVMELIKAQDAINKELLEYVTHNNKNTLDFNSVIQEILERLDKIEKRQDNPTKYPKGTKRW